VRKWRGVPPTICLAGECRRRPVVFCTVRHPAMKAVVPREQRDVCDRPHRFREAAAFRL
jgi:hypothetical protein